MATIRIDGFSTTYSTLSDAISHANDNAIITITSSGNNDNYNFSDGETLAIGSKHLSVWTGTSSTPTANKLIAEKKTVTISGSGKTTSSIQFNVGKQLDILGDINPGKSFTIKDTSVEFLMASNTYEWAAMAIEKGNPTLVIDNASFKVRLKLKDDQHRSSFLVGNSTVSVADVAVFTSQGNVTVTIRNKSVLDVDYLYNSASGAFTVSNSTVYVRNAETWSQGKPESKLDNRGSGGISLLNSTLEAPCIETSTSMTVALSTVNVTGTTFYNTSSGTVTIKTAAEVGEPASTVTGNATFSVAGNLINSGTMTVSATDGESVTFSAADFVSYKVFTASADSATNSTLSITVDSLISETNATDFTIDHATVSVAGLMKNSSTKTSDNQFNITDSTVTVDSFRNEKSASKTKFISSTVTVNTSLRNNGTLTVTGSDTNFTAASVEMVGTASKFYYSGTGALNIGSLSGTITVNENAALTGADVSGGSFSVDSDKNLTLSGTNRLHTSISGAGTVRLSAGATVKELSVTNGNVTALGNATFSETNSFAASAKLTAGGDITLTNTGTLTLTLGLDSISGSGTVREVDLSNISVVETINNSGILSLEISGLGLSFGDNIESYQINSEDLRVGGTGSVQLLSNGQIADDLKATVDEEGVITISQTGVKYLFVNASRVLTDTINYNGRDYELTKDKNSFTEVEKAIKAANTGDIIVFYAVDKSSQSKDLDFISQGTIVVDKDLYFETNTKNELTAVKMDSIKIEPGAEVGFKEGIFSMKAFLDNDGVIDVVEDTRFNGDLVKNEGGTILVGIGSRFVADAIEAGSVLVRTGFLPANMIGPGSAHDKWIIRPVAARIDADMYFIYPETSLTPVDSETSNTGVLTLTLAETEAVNFDRTAVLTVTKTYGETSDTKEFHAVIPANATTAAVELGDFYNADADYDYSTDGIQYTITIHGTELNASSAKLKSDGSKIYIYRGNDGYLHYMVDPEQEPDSQLYNNDPSRLEAWGVTTEYDGVFLVSDVFDLRKIGGTGADQDQYWSNTIYVDDDFTEHAAGDYFTFTTENGKTVKARFASGTESYDPDGYVFAFNSFADAHKSLYVQRHGVRADLNQGVVIRLRAGTYNESGSDLSLNENDIIIEPDKTDGVHYDEVSLTLGYLLSDSLDRANLLDISHLKNLTIGGTDVDKLHNVGWYFGGKDGETSVGSFLDIENLTINGTLKMQTGATVRIVDCDNVISNKHLSVVGGTLIIDRSNITLAGAYSSKGAMELNGTISTENNGYGSGNVIIHDSSLLLKGAQTPEEGLYINLKDGAEFTISGVCSVNGVFTDAKSTPTNTRITFSNATLDESTSITGLGGKGAALYFEGYNTLDGATIQQEGNKGMTIDPGATVNMTDGANISVGGNVQISNAGTITVDNSTMSAGSFVNTGTLTVSNGATIVLGGSTATDVAVDSNYKIKLNVAPANVARTAKVTVTWKNGEGQDCFHVFDEVNIAADKTFITVTLYESEYNSSYIYDAKIEMPGSFVNNGTLVADLVYHNPEPGESPSPTLGINVGTNGTFVNNGVIQIDLSNADMPSDLYIDIGSLFSGGTGTFDIIGGGGTKDPEVPGRIRFADPQTETLFVNKDWAPDGYYTGKNVRPYTYIGYNAYADNSDAGKKSLKFAGDTKKVVYYGGNAADYYTLNLSTAANAPAELTISTVENTSGTDPELASMDSLTVAQNQEVKLSGAKMALTATASVTNGGDLSIEGGESAKLTLNIAPSENDRDVRVMVTTDSHGANPEYHTIHVPVGANTFDVKSGRFINGQTYYVTITDTDQYSPNLNNTLTVNVAANGDSNEIKSIFAQDGSGAKFTFLGNSSWGAPTVTVESHISFVDNDGSIPSWIPMVNGDIPNGISYSIVDGDIVFHAKGSVDKQEISITKTVGNCTFERTLVIEKQTSGTKDYVVSAKLDSSYYYVSTEIDAKAQVADRDNITASDITTKAVTNNGTLTVASVSQGASASKLVLDVNRNPAENRSIQVITVGDETDTRTLFIRKDASTADLFLDEVKVGTQYSRVTITDSYTFTTDELEANSSTLTLSGFATSGTRDSLTITVKKGFETVETTMSEVSESGEVTLTGSFEAGTAYTVSVKETRTLSNPDAVTTKSLASLTATGTVTNTKKINVVDAVFTAAAVENSGTILITNSQFTVGTYAESVFTPGTITNYIDSDFGTITLDAKSSLLTAQNILNGESGAVTIDADDFSGMRKVIDLNEGEADSKITVSGNGYLYYKAETFDYWVADAPQTTLFVNGDWAGHGYGFGDTVETGKYYGYNAFESFSDALKVAYTLPADSGAPLTEEVGAPKYVTINVASATDNAQVYTDFFDKKFLNNILIQPASSAPVTVTVPFSNDGLFLTPADNMNVTIAEGLTLATTHTVNGADNGAVYLNYNGTTGTVTVNGSIKAARGIKIYGETEINGTLTGGTDGADSVIVLRAGKANTAANEHKTVTIGREAQNTIADSQINATWIHYISGDVKTNNTVIDVTGFKYANNHGATAGDNEFADNVTAAVLTSTDTTWNVDFVEAADNVSYAATFNFNGGAFNVKRETGLGTNEAVELGSLITVNLTDGAVFDVVNGSVDNAGTFNVNSATLKVNDTVTVSEGGSLLVDGTSTLKGQGESAAMTLSGTVTLNGGSKLTASNITGTNGTIAAAGAVTVNDSTLSVNSITATAEGASLTFSGSNTLDGVTLTSNGTVTVSAGGSLSVDGTSTLKGQGAAMTLSGTVTLNGGSELTVSNITGVAGVIAAAGAVRVSDSTLSMNSITATAEGASLTFSGENSLNGVTLDATGNVISNTGTLTIDATSSITAATVTSADGNKIKVSATGLGSGFVKVIDVNTTDRTLNVTGNNANVVLATGTPDGVHLAQMNGSDDVYIGNEDQSILYVNSTYSDNIGDVTSDHHLVGYNAFGSFQQALEVAAARTDATEIRVMGSIESEVFTNDIMAYLQGNVSITKGGDVQITLLENGTGGRKDLCFVPASGKTLTIACPIVMSGSGSRPSGIWLNYGGAGTTSLSALINAKSFVGVDGKVNINSTARITATAGDLQFGRPRDTVATVTSVTGTKTDSALLQLHGGDYQIDVRGIQLAEGTTTVTDTKIKAVTLSVTDTEDLDAYGGYSGVVVLNATNTTWDLGDMKVLFYTSKSNIDQDASSTLNFTKSFINIGNILKNVPYQTTDGQDEGEELRSSLAMKINLYGSILNVGTENNSETGTITNAGTIKMDASNGTASELYANSITNNGTITMDNNSILIANSYENYGTMSISGSEAQAYTSFDNYGVVTVSGGATFTVNGTFTQYGNESKYLAVTNATFSADVLDNQGGTISVNGSSFTVSSTSTVAEINKTLTITSTSEQSSTVSFNEILFGGSGSISMDWRSELSFTGFGSNYKDKFTIRADGFVSATDVIKKKVLDYKGNAENKPTEDYYKELLTGWDTDDYKFIVDDDGDLWIQKPYNTVYVKASGNDSEATPDDPDFLTVNGATSVKPNEIVIKDGTQTVIAPLNGITTTIKPGSTFNRGVMGGYSIDSGTEAKTGNINFTIEGGTFEKMVGGGDCVNSGCLTRGTKDTPVTINLTIESGTFKNNVVGGMEYMSTDIGEGCGAFLYGNVYLTIHGGEFQKNIYGGNTAKSTTASAYSVIKGNVNITLDTNPVYDTSSNRINAEKIKVKNLVLGSYSAGSISGNATLTLTGEGSGIEFFDGGEIWGGCGGDYYEISNNRHFETKIEGSRILSFAGFTGDLACSKIRGFDTLTCDKTSKVGINNSVSLSDVKNWTFEYGTFTLDENTVTSGLSGNFVNSFLGDTLTLKNIGSFSGSSWTILENSRSGAFAGFGGEVGDMTVKLFMNDNDTTGTDMTWKPDGYYAGGGYYLKLNSMDSPSKMMLTNTLA